jgi:hypothetical protein
MATSQAATDELGGRFYLQHHVCPTTRFDTMFPRALYLTGRKVHPTDGATGLALSECSKFHFARRVIRPIKTLRTSDRYR